MVELGEIVPIQHLEEALAAGYVRRQEHPTEPLYILNYTQRCQYDQAWNAATRACRGLIVHADTGEVIARPWPKFHNYGEHEEGTLDLAAPVEVTDKLDGSLGILYPLSGGGYAIATRGSFESDQALHATEVWNERYAAGPWEPANGCTYLFEIIYPENRIVVDYGVVDDLVFLGAVVIADGLPASPRFWHGPRAQTFDYPTLADALAAEPRPNAEGVVVRFLLTDELVKIKQDDYVALHRIVTGLNERTVWQMLGDGATVDEIKAPLPEEFWPWVETVAARLLGQASAIEHAARALHDLIVGDLPEGWTRKDYALRATVSPTWSGYLFQLLDGKDPAPAIWKALRPTNPQTLVKVTEDTA